MSLIAVLFIIYYTGEQCSSYEALKVAELEKGNCKQIVNGTDGNWLTVKCWISYYSSYTNFLHCRSKLCRYFTSCFGQSPEWETFCSRKFYWFRKSKFDITTAAKGINGPYFKNIYVKFCGTRRHIKNFFYKIFAIKITRLECKTRNTKRGV